MIERVLQMQLKTKLPETFVFEVKKKLVELIEEREGGKGEKMRGEVK